MPKATKTKKQTPKKPLNAKTPEKGITKADNSKAFQTLIEIAGDITMLRALARYLGSDTIPDFLIRYDDAKEYYRGDLLEPFKKINLPERKTRNVMPYEEDNFNGLVFNGTHWKGITKTYKKMRYTYDSYKKGVQAPTTNNYCQSYACFLWASKGLKNKKLNVELKKSEYTKNVMKMSKLWAKCIRANTLSIKTYIEEEKFKCLQLLETLDMLGNDWGYANDFSNAKDGIVYCNC